MRDQYPPRFSPISPSQPETRYSSCYNLLKIQQSLLSLCLSPLSRKHLFFQLQILSVRRQLWTIKSSKTYEGRLIIWSSLSCKHSESFVNSISPADLLSLSLFIYYPNNLALANNAKSITQQHSSLSRIRFALHLASAQRTDEQFLNLQIFGRFKEISSENWPSHAPSVL